MLVRQFTDEMDVRFLRPDDPVVRVYAEPRLRGAAEACAAAGLPAPDVRVVGDALIDHRLAVREWIDAGVTGVCARRCKQRNAQCRQESGHSHFHSLL